MRMWKTNPRSMCRQHLLGEHSELHKFKPSFEKKHNMVKRIELGQIDPQRMKERHDILVQEMLRRGYRHNSPYGEQPDVSYLPKLRQTLKDSFDKCKDCQKKEQQQ